MRLSSTVAAAACTALALGTSLTAANAVPSTDLGSASGYIVVLEDGTSARSLAAAQADRFGFDLGHVYTSALQGYSAQLTDQAR